MASFHRLYVDCDRSEPVASASDSTLTALPAFTQEDSLNLRITLLEGYSRTAPYRKIAVAGLTLHVALGVKVGNTSALYTQQFVFTASDDLADPYFEAALPMNTQAIADLIGSGEQARAHFEVKVLDGGLPRTVLSKQVIVNAAVIKDGALEEEASPTPISAETCEALFLQRLFTASEENPIVMRNGSVTVALYIDAEGKLQTVRLT